MTVFNLLDNKRLHWQAKQRTHANARNVRERHKGKRKSKDVQRGGVLKDFFVRSGVRLFSLQGSDNRYFPYPRGAGGGGETKTLSAVAAPVRFLSRDLQLPDSVIHAFTLGKGWNSIRDLANFMT